MNRITQIVADATNVSVEYLSVLDDAENAQLVEEALALYEEVKDAPTLAPVFTIDSEERANWYLRKLGNLSAERERIKAQSAAMLADVDKEEQRLRDRFEEDMKRFVLSNLPNGKKTLKLLQGTCSFRTVPVGIKITDKTAALIYCDKEDYGDCIIYKKELNTEYYQYIAAGKAAETGEILPGIEVVPARESFSIKF